MEEPEETTTINNDLEETIISGPTFATARQKMRSTNASKPFNIHVDEQQQQQQENDSTLPSETPLLRLQNTPKLSDCTNQRRSIHLRKVEATASPALNELELSQEGGFDKENRQRTPRGKTRAAAAAAALGMKKVRNTFLFDQFYSEFFYF